MKKKYFITGVTGTGKSTVCKQLSSLGYESYDIENIDGMFAMYHKGTHILFKDYDNIDPEKIKNADWICNIQMLQKLLENQQKDIAFYSGIASNSEDILPLFDRTFLLIATREAVYDRLSNRKGTGYMGDTEVSRQTVLGWKDWWEEKMKRKGTIVIPADITPEEIAKGIIQKI